MTVNFDEMTVNFDGQRPTHVQYRYQFTLQSPSWRSPPKTVNNKQ